MAFPKRIKRIGAGIGALGLTGAGAYTYGGARGMEQGVQQGRQEGYQAGYQAGQADAIQGRSQMGSPEMNRPKINTSPARTPNTNPSSSMSTPETSPAATEKEAAGASSVLDGLTSALRSGGDTAGKRLDDVEESISGMSGASDEAADAASAADDVADDGSEAASESLDEAAESYEKMDGSMTLPGGDEAVSTTGDAASSLDDAAAETSGNPGNLTGSVRDSVGGPMGGSPSAQGADPVPTSSPVPERSSGNFADDVTDTVGSPGPSSSGDAGGDNSTILDSARGYAEDARDYLRENPGQAAAGAGALGAGGTGAYMAMDDDKEASAASMLKSAGDPVGRATDRAENKRQRAPVLNNTIGGAAVGGAGGALMGVPPIIGAPAGALAGMMRGKMQKHRMRGRQEGRAQAQQKIPCDQCPHPKKCKSEGRCLKQSGASKTADDSEESDGDPCWDGYEQVGMKTKNGKKVPNCVPKNKEAAINRLFGSDNPANSSFQKQGASEPEMREGAFSMVNPVLLGPAANTAMDPRSKGVKENLVDYGDRALHATGGTLAGGAAGGVTGGVLGGAAGQLLGGSSSATEAGVVIGSGLGAGLGSSAGAYKGGVAGRRSVNDRRQSDGSDKEAFQMLKSAAENEYEPVSTTEEAQDVVDQRQKHIDNAPGSNEKAQKQVDRLQQSVDQGEVGPAAINHAKAKSGPIGQATALGGTLAGTVGGLGAVPAAKKALPRKAEPLALAAPAAGAFGGTYLGIEGGQEVQKRKINEARRAHGYESLSRDQVPEAMGQGMPLETNKEASRASQKGTTDAEMGEGALSMVDPLLIGPGVNTAMDPRSVGAKQNLVDYGDRAAHATGGTVAGGVGGSLAGATVGGASGAALAGRQGAEAGAILGAGVGSGLGSGLGAYRGGIAGRRSVNDRREPSPENSRDEAPDKEAARMMKTAAGDVRPDFHGAYLSLDHRLPNERAARAASLEEEARRLKDELGQERRQKLNRHREGDVETTSERLGRAIPTGIGLGVLGGAAGALAGPKGALAGGVGAPLVYGGYELARGPRPIEHPDETGLSQQALAAQELYNQIQKGDREVKQELIPTSRERRARRARDRNAIDEQRRRRKERLRSNDKEAMMAKLAKYEIKKKGDGYVVVNADTGEEKSDEPHPTKEKAREHQKALYANAEDSGSTKEALNTKIAAYRRAGRISDEEADYLRNLNESLTSDDLSKTAAAGQVARRVNEVMDPKTLQALSAGAVGAGLAAGPIASVGSKAIDPLREEIRYRRMKKLPGKEFDAGQNLNKRFNVPEGTPKDQALEQARRRAFSILHDHAPEVTRTPSVAREIVRSNVYQGSPEAVIQRGQDLAQNRIEAEQGRSSMRQDRMHQMTNAAEMLNSQAALQA